MSDVVLFYPRTGLDIKKVSVGLPMPLLSIAAEIHEEFSVKIIDQRLTDNWQEELIAELKTRPLCVGITAMTGHQIHHGLSAARIVKDYTEGIPVVWGGMHVTLTAEESIRHPLVDIVVKGDGEWAFRDLVRSLSANKGLEELGSLYWKENGRMRKSEKETGVVLDETKPFPFELVDVERYVHHGEYQFPGVVRSLPFMGSRGCPFKCTFCSEPVLTKVYRMMKPEIIAERVLDMTERFKLDMISFYDEEFFVNTKWANRVAELIDGKVKWWVQTRANDLLRVDLPWLETKGLLAVAPGLESGSNRILEFIKKKETVDEYHEANRRLAETGIFAQYNMMMGFPSETMGELQETIDFTLQLLKDNHNCYINSLSLFTPLPGTELLEQSKGWGYNPPADLESWTGTSRHNFLTPWLKENQAMYLNLAYTSKFVGPRAKMMARSYWFVPKFTFDLYSWIIKRRWRKRIYKSTWDVKLLRFLHTRFVNPMLKSINAKKSSSDQAGPSQPTSSSSPLEEVVQLH